MGSSQGGVLEKAAYALVSVRDLVELFGGVYFNDDGVFVVPKFSTDEMGKLVASGGKGELSCVGRPTGTKNRLYSFDLGKTLGHMTIEERWDFARKYKDAGNVFFKEGKYEFALKNYQEPITSLRHGLRMGESQDEGVPMGARQRDVVPCWMLSEYQ